MMTSIIYGDKFIVFSANAINAVKASMEIDNLSYAHIDVHESTITVNVTSGKTNKYSKEDDIFAQVEQILNKYDIFFKYKRIVL